MDREVSVAEAKSGLSSLINSVAFGGERIVVLSRGKPKAALVSIKDFQKLNNGIKTADQSALLKSAESFRKGLAGRKKKITPIMDELHIIRDGNGR